MGCPGPGSAASGHWWGPRNSRVRLLGAAVDAKTAAASLPGAGWVPGLCEWVGSSSEGTVGQIGR